MMERFRTCWWEFHRDHLLMVKYLTMIKASKWDYLMVNSLAL